MRGVSVECGICFKGHARVGKASALPGLNGGAGSRKRRDREDDEEDEDGVLSPKMEKAVTIMTIAVVIVIVGIIIAIVGNVLGWFKFGSSSDKKDDKNKIKVFCVYTFIN